VNGISELWKEIKSELAVVLQKQQLKPT